MAAAYSLPPASTVARWESAIGAKSTMVHAPQLKSVGSGDEIVRNIQASGLPTGPDRALPWAVVVVAARRGRKASESMSTVLIAVQPEEVVARSPRAACVCALAHRSASALDLESEPRAD